MGEGWAIFWLMGGGLLPTPSRENLISTLVLNWVLASMCSCSQKSWILFAVSTCRTVVHSFQNLIWTAMTLLFTATSFFSLVCTAVLWYYLILTQLNPIFSFHQEDLLFSRKYLKGTEVEMAKFFRFGHIWIH